MRSDASDQKKISVTFRHEMATGLPYVKNSGEESTVIAGEANFTITFPAWVPLPRPGETVNVFSDVEAFPYRSSGGEVAMTVVNVAYDYFFNSPPQSTVYECMVTIFVLSIPWEDYAEEVLSP